MKLPRIIASEPVSLAIAVGEDGDTLQTVDNVGSGQITDDGTLHLYGPDGVERAQFEQWHHVVERYYDVVV